jgi:mRNA interferase HigB
MQCRVHIIKAKTLKEFARRHPDAAHALADWLSVAERCEWTNLADVRSIYPHADAVEVASGRSVTVFNIRGNRYRLITAIHYNRQKIYTLRFHTHSEYDRGSWKEAL